MASFDTSGGTCICNDTSATGPCEAVWHVPPPHTIKEPQNRKERRRKKSSRWKKKKKSNALK